VVPSAPIPIGPFEGPSLTPKPRSMKSSTASFILTETATVSATGDGAAGVAALLVEALAARTGHVPTVAATPGAGIVLRIAGTGKPESYGLAVDKGAVTITSPSSAGLFWGVQTLLQLLPPAKTNLPVEVPGVTIEDEPRFAWRGMHLDVSRHFFPVSFIKRYLDLLAMHKMNRFHWHLADDHGWRIEIKKYPRLTSVGAWREDHRDEDWGRQAAFRKKVPAGSKPYGGFYSQDEIREVVAYASARQITIIPEIDMPGHSQALLAGYPELSCVNNKKYSVPYGSVYPFSDPLCPCEEGTYTFVQDVLTELLTLFPSPMIHIGADEVNRSSWEASPVCQALMKKEGMHASEELQSYFVKRVATFLSEKGRRTIGWQEMTEGGAPAGSIIMPWKGGDGLMPAIKAGHETVVANSEVYYFTPVRSELHKDWVDLRKTYEYDPVPAGLNEVEAALVQGAQGHLWSEESQVPADVEYAVATAMAAVSESLWVDAKARNWDDFLRRAPEHFKRFDAMAVNYFVPRPTISANPFFSDSTEITIALPPLAEAIRYTLDGSAPGPQSEQYVRPFKVAQGVTVKATAYYPGGHTSRASSMTLKALQVHEGSAESGAPGIAYEYLEGAVEAARDVATSKVLRRKGQGVLPTITLPREHRDVEFAVRYTGKVFAAEEGVYVLCSESNDGTLIEIENDLVVDNDGVHGVRDVCGEVALKQGHHPIRVTYFQLGGGTSLRVDFHYKGHARVPLSEKLLSH
jgi:hexosaminidase